MSGHNDPQPDAKWMDKAFSNLFELYVWPELMRRVERGDLSNPYPLSHLRGLQILFNPAGGKPIVRINEQVRGICEISTKPGVTINLGDPVSNEDVESIGEIHLHGYESDFGHATFVRRTDGGWWGYFNFIYWRGFSQRHVEVAEQFMTAAKLSRNESLWAPFVDNLYAAAELAAKASLLRLDDGQAIARSKKHSTVKAMFNRQRVIGNVEPEHTTALNRLWRIRQSGRYAEEITSIAPAEADELLRVVNEMLNAARERSNL